LSGDRISLLTTDYDGTLSPLDATLEDSRVSPTLEVVLRAIAEKTKLAVVTSKSFEFIRRRVPYANAWGCVGGLDVRFDDGKEFTASPPVDVEAALRKAKAILGDAVSYEEKRGPTSLLGFSVDWRGRPTPTDVARAMATLKKDGICVAHEPHNPFADFFGSPPDKGAAVSRIKEALGVSGGALFMGDSSTDNPAFWEVEIPVGIDHGQPLGSLECSFIVTQDGVTPFLRGLYERDMVFGPGLPGLLRK
jgi:hydroxymethylpyrimidine pyrophosphatase-like HAD family hydrolase